MEPRRKYENTKKVKTEGAIAIEIEEPQPGTSREDKDLGYIDPTDPSSCDDHRQSKEHESLAVGTCIEDIALSKSVDDVYSNSDESPQHSHARRKSLDLSSERSSPLPFHLVRTQSRTLTFRRKKTDKGKEKKQRSKFWTLRLKKPLPGRLRKGKDHGLPEAHPSMDDGSCVCTGYRRTEDHVLGPGIVFRAQGSAPGQNPRVISIPGSNLGSVFPDLLQYVPAPPGQPLDLTLFNANEYPTEDIDALLIAQRAHDIEQGIEISPNQLSHSPESHDWPASHVTDSDSDLSLASSLHTQCAISDHTQPAESASLGPAMAAAAPDPDEESYASASTSTSLPRTIHTQVDYIHCLVPDLLQIASCGFYWGVMDRYEAERLLENKPEGTFLLRDSAQEEFLFSVSFRRYGRSLHARIEQWNHKFSFDSHDPGVYSSDSVCGLMEHYKDPSCCMFFEPMLTLPLHRTFPFSLQHLCRSVIGSNITYDGINFLPLPKSLRQYIKYYHYKQKVRVRRFECSH